MSRNFYNNVYYFITVPTVRCFPFFDTIEKKSLILARLEKSKGLFRVEDLDFSIMSNHYHFVSYFRDGRIIPRLLQMVNGGSAYDLNRITDNKKPVWDEYFIYLIDKEVLLSKVRGYVVGNPVKHSEVKTLAELEKYPFSSFYTLTKKIDREQVLSWIQSVILLEDEKFLETLG